MLGVFWITSDCNMKCIYCYEGNDKKKLYMSKDIVERSLDFLVKTMKQIGDNELKIEIHGGEPFLAFELMKYLVESAKKKCEDTGIGLVIGCTTNATLLNDERIEFICKEIKNITISMDGDEETQNYSRPFVNGSASYKVVDSTMKKLLIKCPELRVRLTYTHDTVSKLFENVIYLSKLGVKYIAPARDFYDQQFGKEEFKILKDELKKIDEFLSTALDTHFGLLERDLIKRLGRCTGGIDNVQIDPLGILYPCALAVGNEEFIIGNVIDGIDENKRDYLLSFSDKKNKECAGCDYYFYCEQTRCKIINRIIMGDFCKPSPIVCAEKNVLYDIMFRSSV